MFFNCLIFWEGCGDRFCVNVFIVVNISIRFKWLIKIIIIDDFYKFFNDLNRKYDYYL